MLYRRYQELAAVVKTYCALIESVSADDREWLSGIAKLLPRLHAAVALVAPAVTIEPIRAIADLDERFDVFSRLRELLGERDGYWLEFDRTGAFHTMTGSLADDLTDIYCELKYGLDLLDRSPEEAVRYWVCAFEHHWGKHLSDAARHLAELASRGELDL